MEERIKVGDEVLVLGTAFFEKAKVIDRVKGVYLLNNNMKLSKDLHPLNSKMVVERFNQKKWDYLIAKQFTPKKLRKIEASIEGLSADNLIAIFSKLERIINKYL